MSRIALLVGVDAYPSAPLTGCVADANAIADLLERHDNGAPNFACRAMLSNKVDISRAGLRQAVSALFQKADIDLAVFYFAGHGAHNEFGGHLVTPDAVDGDEGVQMEQIIGLANNSPAKERLIILDCCHAGAVGDLLATKSPAPLEEGVSILAACRGTEPAEERAGRGLFTSLVCDALAGGAADVTGSVTVAGIYAYVDEVLTGWDQRPLFKSNVSKLTSIRKAAAAVSPETLRLLVQYFPQPEYDFQLDPSFEPTEEPRNEENERTFQHLQNYRAARLVEPCGTPHMYYAAVQSRSCQLTPLGRFYWHRVKNGQI